MDPYTSLLAATGVMTLVKNAFSAVFNDANFATEAWYESVKFRTAIRDRYVDYIARTVGVFPLFGTTREAAVASAYVDVGLSSDLERDRYRDRVEIEESLTLQRDASPGFDKRQSRARALTDVVEGTTKAIALIGLPGSGKTTALKHLALEAAQGRRFRARRLIPIVLAVRDLSLQKRSVRQGIRDLLRAFGIQAEEAVFRKLFERGDVLLVLDGIDEADARFQRHLVRQISILRETYPHVLICVSGRPHSLDYGMLGFEKWETLPLTVEQRLAIVKTWFGAVDIVKGERFLSDCAREPGLLDMGSNPLLLCMMCALYHNDLRIPAEPEELYARMVEGLLGGWDAFRNVVRESVLGHLSHLKRVQLVSGVAGMLFEESLRVFTASDVERVGVLATTRSRVRLPLPDAHQLLRALYSDFGILVERAPGRYSFSHLTLQEYLAARYVVDQRREIDMLPRAIANRWHDFIVLIVRLLPKADVFIRRLMGGVDPTREGDVALAVRVWRAKPLVDHGIARDAVEALISRALVALRVLKANYTIEGDVLIATLSSEVLPARVKTKTTASKAGSSADDSLTVLKNVPQILQVAELAGLELHTNHWRTGVPFTLPAEGVQLRAVDIRFVS